MQGSPVDFPRSACGFVRPVLGPQTTQESFHLLAGDFMNVGVVSGRVEKLECPADALTTAEMHQATAFYLSPAGQKLLDLIPPLAAEASATMQERIKPYLPQIEAAVQHEVSEVLARRAKPETRQ